MIAQALTVGSASAVQIPLGGSSSTFPVVFPGNTLKLLARNANTGNVYIGNSSSVTTTTGALVPQATKQGSAATGQAAEHGPDYLILPAVAAWLIADTAAQVVDIIAF